MHEAGQRAAGAAHGDLAEVSPVHLGLLGGECLQSQESFARGGRSRATARRSWIMLPV